ncbi:NigD1/NigD2 family lipoprotein [Bacteroides sp.]
MKRGLQCIVLVLGLCLFASCKDDDYVYPSVQLEFLTAETGSDGYIRSVITDEGKLLPIEKDHTRSRFTANSSVRIVANYELLSEEGQDEIRIYTLLKPVSADPQTVKEFPGGVVKDDPANVQSIWMGRDYLNMVLAVQAQSGKHIFGFVEESVVKPGGDGRPMVTLSLYHDAGGDVEAYTQRGYLSIPLKNRYPQGAHIEFKVNTYDGGKNYRFDYKPTDN